MANHARGSDNSNVKLDEKDVIEIRRRYYDVLNYITQKELANEYNVSQAEISRIVTRKYWKHLI